MKLEEVKKLYNFIYKKHVIDIAKYDKVFDRDTLFKIKTSSVADEQDSIYFEDFKLTFEQEEALITNFLEYAEYKDDTPSLFLENEECIKAVIMKNYKITHIAGQSYQNLHLSRIPSPKYDFVIKTFIENRVGIMLNHNTPKYLKNNIDIVLLSLQNNINTIEYVDESNFTHEEINKIIDILITKKYKYNAKSPGFIKNNKILTLLTLRYQDSYRNTNAGIRFMSVDLMKQCMKDPRVFNLYYETAVFDLYRTLFMGFPLNCYKEWETILKIMLDDGNWKNQYRAQFCSTILKSKPTINNFHKIFEIFIDESWNLYQEKNSIYFANIFDNICQKLKESKELEGALRNIEHLDEIKEILKDKYQYLLNAMQYYFQIYHSDIENKLESIIPYRDEISKYIALYVAICKENYKKEVKIKLDSVIKPYFKLNEKNETIKEQIKYLKQKENFKSLYANKNKKVVSFIENLLLKYDGITSNILTKMLDEFIVLNKSKLKDIIDEPLYYKDYLRYLEALKLIARLNLKNISYDSPEMNNYKDIITYNVEKDKYYYNGIEFNDELLEKYTEYQNYEKVFEGIKFELITYIKNIKIKGNRKTIYTYYGLSFTEKELAEAKAKYPEVFKDIEKVITPTKSTIHEYDKLDNVIRDVLQKEMPFTDEYFTFDLENSLEILEGRDILTLFHGINIDKNFMEIFKPYLEKQEPEVKFFQKYVICASWVLIMNNHNNFISDSILNKLKTLINNSEDLIILVNRFNIDKNNLKELIILLENIKFIKSKKTIESAILGEDTINDLTKNSGGDRNDIIKKAVFLTCEMAKNDKKTVPFIEGQTDSYQYSMYDSLDETILLSGINTNSCCRISGQDNDFFHYCALDKNGFIIKITDLNDNFIAKAAGFRNGNCVFINQLRTINKGSYSISKLIETFKKACEDIVNISQNNYEETNKIDYVFITKSYALSDYTTNILNEDARTAIGVNPMDTKSEDWNKFLSISKLGPISRFATDYGNYSLICMAALDDNKVSPENIKKGDVEALYERKRNKVIVSEFTLDVYQKVMKIKAMDSYDTYNQIEVNKAFNESTFFVGDNWYIVCYKNTIIDSKYLEFDKHAEKEFNLVKDIIEKHLDINQGLENTNIDVQFVKNLGRFYLQST